jgi:hypothetical protein
MLRRRTRLHREQRVTTWTTARTPEKFQEISRWALALALRPGGSGNRHSSSCNRADAASRQRQRFRQRSLTPAFAITPTLRPPPRFALRLRPIAPTGIPAPPTPRRLLASFTAIASLGPTRTEPSFTVFQKTAPLSKRPRPLIGGAPEWILRWAHGRSYSRRSSLGGERQLFAEAFSSTRQQLPPV